MNWEIIKDQLDYPSIGGISKLVYVYIIRLSSSKGKKLKLKIQPNSILRIFAVYGLKLNIEISNYR